MKEKGSHLAPLTGIGRESGWDKRSFESKILVMCSAETRMKKRVSNDVLSIDEFSLGKEKEKASFKVWFETCELVFQTFSSFIFANTQYPCLITGIDRTYHDLEMILFLEKMQEFLFCTWKRGRNTWNLIFNLFLVLFRTKLKGQKLGTRVS
jgi:hypothetical protein